MLDDLVAAGKIRYYGVSVEKVEEALKAIEFPNVQTVQIIFNCFRQRPADVFFAKAKEKQVGILARVPLASGLLTGKLRRDSTFAADDHRNFNRRGETFDVGETFSGVDYEIGLAAVEEIRKLLPAGVSMSQFALRWILMFDAVSCAIPGGKRAEQVADNCGASELPPLTPEAMAAVQRIYDEKNPPTGAASLVNNDARRTGVPARRAQPQRLCALRRRGGHARPPREPMVFHYNGWRMNVLFIGGTGIVSSACTRLALRRGIRSHAAYPRAACRRLAGRRGDGARGYQRSAGGCAGAARAAVRRRRQLDCVYSGGHRARPGIVSRTHPAIHFHQFGQRLSETGHRLPDYRIDAAGQPALGLFQKQDRVRGAFAQGLSRRRIPRHHRPAFAYLWRESDSAGDQ